MAITVKRFDRGELKSPKLLANGWLKVDGYVGRTGLLEYTQADGTKWVEYRPPDEAFRADVLDSFASVPLTNDHPPGGVLDASNTKLYQVGTVDRPAQDGKFARAAILVTDAQAVADIQAGKRELSMGYTCELDCTPGTHENKHYDAVQRNISGNHVALCDHARGGSEIRLRVDSHDTVDVESKQVPGQRTPEEKNQMLKIKIDGVEVEVSELAAQLIAKVQKTDAEARSAVQNALDKANARADSAEASVKKLQTDLIEAPVKAATALAARTALEASAKKLGVETCDGLNDSDLRKAAVAKSGVKCDGKPDAYIEAAFDYALAKLDTEPGAITAPAIPATAPVKTDAADDSLEAHQRRYAAAMREMHKPQVSK